MRWSANLAGEYILPLTEDVLGIHILQGRTPTRIVRCKDCKKTDHTREGIVCKRYKTAYHLTDPEGFCHEGEL